MQTGFKPCHPFGEVTLYCFTLRLAYVITCTVLVLCNYMYIQYSDDDTFFVAKKTKLYLCIIHICSKCVTEKWGLLQLSFIAALFSCRGRVIPAFKSIKHLSLLKNECTNIKLNKAANHWIQMKKCHLFLIPNLYRLIQTCLSNERLCKIIDSKFPAYIFWNIY